MTKQPMMYGNMRVTAVICRPCDIFTFTFDAAFNKWRDSDKKIPCPNCEHKEVKWFSRQLDHYMKFVCPKCKIIGEGDCNQVTASDGSIDLELMEGSEQIPEETRIEIPVDNLRMSPNGKAKLKKKIRDNKGKKK